MQKKLKIIELQKNAPQTNIISKIDDQITQKERKRGNNLEICIKIIALLSALIRIYFIIFTY